MPKTDLRIQYMSPSPDNKSQPSATNQAANVRKSSMPAASNHMTGQNSLEKPILTQGNDRKKEPVIEPINIQNLKQQIIAQHPRANSNPRSSSQVAQTQ